MKTLVLGTSSYKKVTILLIGEEFARRLRTQGATAFYLLI